MPVNVQQRGRRFQLRVKHALLPKPFFFTFDTEPEARNYGKQLDALLTRGIVPYELLGLFPRQSDDPFLVNIIGQFESDASPAPSDKEVLAVRAHEVVGVRVSGVTFTWADDYVRKLKRERNLSPGTVRKRIGSLARVIDWYRRRTTASGQVPHVNPLRLLPRGYSTYTEGDVAPGAVAKRDVVRNRRLSADEHARILIVLAGHKREDSERSHSTDPAFSMLYELIVDTGLRLSECYRLRISSIDFEHAIINVDGSKGLRAALKPRVVPLKLAVRQRLRDWCDPPVPI